MCLYLYSVYPNSIRNPFTILLVFHSEFSPRTLRSVKEILNKLKVNFWVFSRRDPALFLIPNRNICIGAFRKRDNQNHKVLGPIRFRTIQKSDY